VDIGHLFMSVSWFSIASVPCKTRKAVGMPVAVDAIGITTAALLTWGVMHELAVRLGCIHSLG
jgi:hypothetical protein